LTNSKVSSEFNFLSLRCDTSISPNKIQFDKFKKCNFSIYSDKLLDSKIGFNKKLLLLKENIRSDFNKTKESLNFENEKNIRANKVINRMNATKVLINNSSQIALNKADLNGTLNIKFHFNKTGFPNYK
jgi:hypothetical protein